MPRQFETENNIRQQDLEELVNNSSEAEKSCEIKKRVIKARKIQEERYKIIFLFFAILILVIICL